MQGIHLDRVTQWAQAHIPELAPPLEFSLIAGGHSNLTYKFVDARGAAFVLRRPPLGHVLESAHDMGREHRIIAALWGTGVPVAPALGLCSDAAVNDAPFYLMRFVEGVVPHDAAALRDTPAGERRRLGERVIEALARLHRINPDDVGLGDLGRKEAYLARQLRRWSKQWEATKTHEIPEMEESERLLRETMPEQVGTAIVHGDYRLGNMIVAGGDIRAILDWELCTLGDPLADVGYLLNNCTLPGEPGAELMATGAGGSQTGTNCAPRMPMRRGGIWRTSVTTARSRTGAWRRLGRACTSAIWLVRWGRAVGWIWIGRRLGWRCGRGRHWSCYADGALGGLGVRSE